MKVRPRREKAGAGIRWPIEIEAALAASAPQRRPRKEIKQALLDRLRSDSERPPGGLGTLRANAGEWNETGVPGIRSKTLYHDTEAGVVTMLVRMDPGAAYPSHRHTRRTEQCLVLEGDLRREDGTVLRKGDFIWGVPGSVDPVLTTESGNLLLIVQAPPS